MRGPTLTISRKQFKSKWRTEANQNAKRRSCSLTPQKWLILKKLVHVFPRYGPKTFSKTPIWPIKRSFVQDTETSHRSHECRFRFVYDSLQIRIFKYTVGRNLVLNSKVLRALCNQQQWISDVGSTKWRSQKYDLWLESGKLQKLKLQRYNEVALNPHSRT